MTLEISAKRASEVADEVSTETMNRLGLLLGDLLPRLVSATIQFSAHGKCYQLVVRKDGTVMVTTGGPNDGA